MTIYYKEFKTTSDFITNLKWKAHKNIFQNYQVTHSNDDLPRSFLFLERKFLYKESVTQVYWEYLRHNFLYYLLVLVVIISDQVTPPLLYSQPAFLTPNDEIHIPDT